MTEPAEEVGGRLDDAIALYEQLIDANGPDLAVDEAVRLFPDCEAELRECDRIRGRTDAYCAPLRRVTTAAAAPPCIEGYENLQEIGRGGMGVVYRALQQSTNRTVAIKVIRPERLAVLSKPDREEIIARFRIEAIATMDHHNIVRVYHTGNVGGVPYFVMELVQGVTLRELAQSGGCTLLEAVGFLEQAARGIHHAHRHGVLHRDIKPANIIIDLPAKTAKVADFGLAKLDHLTSADQRPGDPQAAAVMGTLPYMSPEQLVDSDDVTVASDIYGLGATLYEALTGRPPFCGAPRDVRRAIASEGPVPLRSVNPDIPKRLEQLCARCLSKRPADRFDSAQTFADELAKLRNSPNGNAAVLFANMGWPLLLFGLIGLAIHAGVQWLVDRHRPEVLVWLALFSTYLPMFAVFWLTKLPVRYQARAAQRELWSIWLGHMLAAGVTFAASRNAADSVAGAIAAGYPVFAATTGMAFLAMAANFWRFHYVLGAAWLATAVTMIRAPRWAPLEFGIATALSSLVIGVYELYLLRENLLDQPVPAATTRGGAAWHDVSLPAYPLAHSRQFATEETE